MPAADRRTFPLVPRRRRLTGLPIGDLPSRRRGHGSEVIGSRPYVPGDPVSTIDWFASARLSAATGGDEFVVRDRAADEAPRVVLVIDRRPAMGLYPSPLPWLSKRLALREAVASIVASAVAARADVAALDFAGGEPAWLPPGRRDRALLLAERQSDATPFDAPEDNLDRAFAFLGRHRDRPPDGQLRLRALGLPRAACGRALARGGRARLGPRARRDPGPRLGAELPGDRLGGRARSRTRGPARFARSG